MKTDPDLDQIEGSEWKKICRDLIQWMPDDIFDYREVGLYQKPAIKIHDDDLLQKLDTYYQCVHLITLMESLDLVREIEVVVLNNSVSLFDSYRKHLKVELINDKNPTGTESGLIMAAPEPRLIALHRTLKGNGEI